MPRLSPTLALLGLAATGSLLLAEEPAPPDAETQKRMEEVLRERQVKTEADRVAGLHALETGRRLKQEGRLEEAVDALERAVALIPSSREAREELQAVKSALGATADRRKEILEALAKAQGAREDQQRVVVEGRVREGQRLMGERRFAEALQVLKEAQETVRWMPYGAAEADRWRSEVGSLLRQAERGAVEEANRRREAQLREAASEVAKDYEAMRRQHERRVASLRSQGTEALKAARWDEAEKVAREIEEMVPGDAGAAHLKLLARERRHVSVRSGLRKSYAEEWANLRENSKEKQIPYGAREGETMRHPDNWEEIQRRGQQTVAGQVEQEPQWKQALRGKLSQTVHFKFPGIPFDQAKEYLETQGRVVINVDKLARDANPELDTTHITLSSPEEGMTLESALNYLCRAVTLAWTLRDETITITTQEGLKEKPDLRQYDVRDLLGQITDYIGPTISMGGGGGSSPGIKFDDTAEGDDEKKITGDTLMEFIKEYVDKSIWTEAENSITFRNGKLFVTAPMATHRKILEVLKGFREQRTLQVLIQTRFITINDVSFEAIGVDWKGINPGGTLPGVTALPTGSTAGFMNPRGLRTDIRGAVVNQGQLITGMFPRTFNGSMNTAGGLGMQVAFLDTFQAEAIIEMVEKSGKANILTAPTLLCFNTQRANMVSVVQQAYIQDITAVVQVQAVGYDPEIGYVQTGIVFDVRPIVSADRKYITLELRPTVSELKQIRTVFTSGAVTTGGPAQQNIFVEAPVVNMNAIRTTVSVPDGGTLMIGGLTQYDETRNHTAVPFLSKIPFLQALFSNKAEAQNRQSLVILVKAQIIDQKEIEEERFGKE